MQNPDHGRADLKFSAVNPKDYSKLSRIYANVE